MHIESPHCTAFSGEREHRFRSNVNSWRTTAQINAPCASHFLFKTGMWQAKRKTEMVMAYQGWLCGKQDICDL
jgi:hypothetical protein